MEESDPRIIIEPTRYGSIDTHPHSNLTFFPEVSNEVRGITITIDSDSKPELDFRKSSIQKECSLVFFRFIQTIWGEAWIRKCAFSLFIFCVFLVIFVNLSFPEVKKELLSSHRQ